MQLSSANDVKIYNLSSGKSIPEWISDTKRRKLEKKNIDIRRRIQLLQDFEMPDVSHTVNVTEDGKYIFATGSYKPFLKCYDLRDLSLKFLRGLDDDVIKLITLNEDYSKLIMLEENRYVELHIAHGRYFRLRIPKFGRDMAFSEETGDLYIVSSGSEIYRLNLERGQFLEPLITQATSSTCCSFNEHHQLFVCGTIDGHVEAWDPRDRSRVGILDCALMHEKRDALQLAVGTSTGQVLLYDIRSSRPLLIKDQQMALPIRKIEFVRADEDLVLTMDSRVLKAWNNSTGKPFAAIEPGTNLSDFTRYPNSGLLFFANEAPKMLQYFVPSIGPAPKWCSYLETITEELEETEQPAGNALQSVVNGNLCLVFDDYKFLTSGQLDQLGLSHLIGSNLLRAYMHGYFIDVRLYNKAVTFTQPFAYDNYKKRKLLDKVESERDAVGVVKKTEKKKLPKVNKALAEKLLLEQESMTEKKQNKKQKKRAHIATDVLGDSRFQSLFENADFEVDEQSEHFQLINPAIKHLQAVKETKRKMAVKDNEDGGESSDNEQGTKSGLFMEDDDKRNEDDGSSVTSSSSSSSNKEDDREDDDDEGDEQDEEEKHEEETKQNLKGNKAKSRPKSFKLYELRAGEDFDRWYSQDDDSTATTSTPLGQRVTERTGDPMAEEATIGGRSISFAVRERGPSATRAAGTRERQKAHLEERRETRRSAGQITRTLKKIGFGRGRGRGGRGRR